MTTVLAGLYVHSESMSRQKQTEVFKQQVGNAVLVLNPMTDLDKRDF